MQILILTLTWDGEGGLKLSSVIDPESRTANFDEPKKFPVVIMGGATEIQPKDPGLDVPERNITMLWANTLFNINQRRKKQLFL